ncbi:MAG: MauE/DoxX family redox-associated membrane protein [bacterium]
MQARNNTFSFMAFIRHPVFLACLKIILGALFIISSVPKIGHPQNFIEAIAAYRILPFALLPILAATVPWIQLFAGVFLVLDIFVQSSALIISGLLFVFIVAIASAFSRGLDIECGCFDLMGLEDKVGWVALIRDTIFLMGSGLLVIFDKNTLNFYGVTKKFFK